QMQTQQVRVLTAVATIDRLVDRIALALNQTTKWQLDYARAFEGVERSTIGDLNKEAEQLIRNLSDPTNKDRNLQRAEELKGALARARRAFDTFSEESPSVSARLLRFSNQMLTASYRGRKSEAELTALLQQPLEGEFPLGNRLIPFIIDPTSRRLHIT